ncbi:unnamed protein product [Staurois parvus]|uniref:Uncharacterized protein n=1 Tax=Staurois parvus TaxID=386267 RepID=A0ABN9BTS9_9NEOB|nr:unnamed protein product [Staurois parvus]
MPLGRKGLTSGVIKGLTVCCVVFNIKLVCVFHCNHITLDGCAVQSHPKQCSHADW